MTKTLSVGLSDDSKINYITFNFHSISEMNFFCDDLAAYIINKYSNYFLNLIINKNYGYFNKYDKIEIYKIAKNEFSNIYSEGFQFQKLTIKEKLYDFFLEEQYDTIVLEGFVRFRLQEYLEELELMVDYAVDEYFVKQEYESFISMLKEFVELQRPLRKIIHICSEKCGRYSIYDENSEALTRSQILGFGDNEIGELINEDDILLSALISISPSKIVIHHIENIKNKQLIETIKKVFDNKITVCKGCNICDKQI